MSESRIEQVARLEGLAAVLDRGDREAIRAVLADRDRLLKVARAVVGHIDPYHLRAVYDGAANLSGDAVREAGCVVDQALAALTAAAGEAE
jgi:ketosteroid isomerase-like protein